MTVPLKIWDLKAYNSHVEREHSTNGLYYGCMLAILLYNLFLFFSTRSRSYGAYVLFMTVSIFFYLAWSGSGNQYVWPESQFFAQRMWPITGSALAASIFLFQTYFLDIKQTLPRVYKFYLAYIALNATFAVLNTFLPIRQAQLLGISSGVTCALLGFSAPIYLLFKRNRQAKFFVAAWSVFFFFIILGSLSILGLSKISMAISSYGAQIGSAFEAILLSFGLADRINVLKKKQLEQSKNIIEGLKKIEFLKGRLEKALAATKSMSQCTNGQETIEIAETYIKRELSDQALVGIAFIEKTSASIEHASPQSTKEIHFPVHWKDQDFGAFALSFASEAPLSDEVRWFTETLCQSLALSLQNIYYQEHLKDLVDERTRDLNKALLSLKERQNKIDLILRHIQQGIFTFSDDFRIDSEYSRHLLDIFEITPQDITQLTLNELVFNRCRLNAEEKSMAVESLRSSFGVDSILWDVNAHHLPSRLEQLSRQRAQKTIEFDWMPIVSDQREIEKVMVVVKDITDRLVLEQKIHEEDKAKEEFLSIITSLVSCDRHALDSFFKESLAIISSLELQLAVGVDPKLIFRQLHTLKGLCRMLNLSGLSNIIHNCETMISGLASITEETIRDLTAGLSEYKLEYEKCESVYKQILGREESKFAPWNLLHFVNIMLSERAEHIVRKGHSIDRITADDGLVIWDRGIAKDLRDILMHIFNNSLDHGYFIPYEDLAAKPPIHIRLSARIDEDNVIITHEDFGAGINLEKLKEKARDRGLSFDDPYDIIFADGVSSAKEVSMTSVRGVGMSFVKQRVDEMQGSIKVSANEPSGTVFSIVLPKSVVCSKAVSSAA